MLSSSSSLFSHGILPFLSAVHDHLQCYNQELPNHTQFTVTSLWRCGMYQVLDRYRGWRYFFWGGNFSLIEMFIETIYCYIVI